MATKVSQSSYDEQLRGKLRFYPRMPDTRRLLQLTRSEKFWTKLFHGLAMKDMAGISWTRPEAVEMLTHLASITPSRLEELIEPLRNLGPLILDPVVRERIAHAHAMAASLRLLLQQERNTKTP